MSTSRAHLQDLWRQLEELEAERDPDRLRAVREQARRAMNSAVDQGLGRVGLTAMLELMEDVDFRGWY